MTAIHTSPLGFHDGEKKVHNLLHIPDRDNPTTPGMSPHATRLLHISSLLAIGTIDDDGMPWTTLLGGEPGFARSLGQSIVGIKALVDNKYDPVVQILAGDMQAREAHEGARGARAVSVLGLDLASRNRVKLSGKILTGALGTHGPNADNPEDATSEIQLVIVVQNSLGLCPKYLNKKEIISCLPKAVQISNALPLSVHAVQLLAKVDTFFISSSYHMKSMGINIRGGPPGFVRVITNDSSETVLVYPEYSGNRLYQTLGNLYTTPEAGLVFPDFETGDVLYITGTTEIMFGKGAAEILPCSSLAVKVHVNAAHFVQRGLSFRGTPGEFSPYNPPVRFLTTERARTDAQVTSDNVAYAKLLARDLLTPTIARFRFSISDPKAAGRWKPGQYVALAFEEELSLGYSHMRNDDPKSLNDDYIRAFTVSSSPGGNLPEDEFEITIRNVGVATSFLFRQNIRAELEIPLQRFGGMFTITQGAGEVVSFVAGGIGITPILAQLPDLELSRIRLYWTVNARDIDLVVDTIDRCPALGPSTRVFVSGVDDSIQREKGTILETLEQSGMQVTPRRILASDLQFDLSISSKWYICTGTALRKALLDWLPHEKTIYEDFNY